MPSLPAPLATVPIRDDDEGLFSRDVSGQLVRLDAPTEEDYREEITLQIDGQPVTVPRARPLQDANGNIVTNLQGRTTPRYTTIYDAAVKLYVHGPGDEAKIPIPTLCHEPHMKPVAVCRLCVVQICSQRDGKTRRERKLLPACQHQVKAGMEVFTMNGPGADGARVRQSVKVLTELLAADHLHPAEPPALEQEFAPYNELGEMVTRCSAAPARMGLDLFSRPPRPAPPRAGRRGLDDSSPVFTVDHSACILCDRCVRSCNEVRGNDVIGRTGKGAYAGIGFDLNDPMGESSCVQCGECMVSCPTSAITFKPGARVQLRQHGKVSEVLSAAELMADPVFNGIPPKFLLWQEGLVLRRRLRAGEQLFQEGDAGNTAFLIRSGLIEVTVGGRGHSAANARQRFTRGPKDLILGEVACLTGTPRLATGRALEATEVWELRRNVLDRLLRLPGNRPDFEKNYRDRILDVVLQKSELFQGLEPAAFTEIADFLRPAIEFVRVSQGQTLFRQGDEADAMYLIRLGHVRIGFEGYGSESKVLSCGPGTVLGEIGLLALSAEDTHRPEEADARLAEALASAGGRLEEAIPSGYRSATCSALNSMELIRLRRGTFLEMIARFPVLRRRLVAISLHRLRGESGIHPRLAEYVEQGLYEGRSILALDLDLCTRCDECTKGCVQKHGDASHGVPITRLLRDGRRFGRFLVATSCRSCVDPHCMTGCPVDSIHRGKHLQIVIEDHCIGCGLCASNCPYGSIFMEPIHPAHMAAPATAPAGQTRGRPQLKAATCDLCDAEGKLETPQPSCVSSCPHEAAFRLPGEELLRRVRAGENALR